MTLGRKVVSPKKCGRVLYTYINYVGRSEFGAKINTNTYLHLLHVNSFEKNDNDRGKEIRASVYRLLGIC